MATTFLAQILGVYCIAFAVLMLFRKKVYVSVLESYYGDPATIFLPGLAASFLGLLMVLGHNDWSSVPAVVVTLFGWAALVKGLWLIYFPHSAVMSIELSKAKQWSRVYAAVLLLVGAYLCYTGFVG